MHEHSEDEEDSVIQLEHTERRAESGSAPDQLSVAHCGPTGGEAGAMCGSLTFLRALDDVVVGMVDDARDPRREELDGVFISSRTFNPMLGFVPGDALGILADDKLNANRQRLLHAVRRASREPCHAARSDQLPLESPWQYFVSCALPALHHAAESVLSAPRMTADR
jgi:hypothetical protein